MEEEAASPPEPCTVAEQARVGRADASPSALGISMSPSGGMIVLMEGGGADRQMRLLPLTAVGGPGRPAQALPAAAGAELFAIRALGDAHLVLLRETCEGRICFPGRLVDAAGAGLGEAMAGPIPDFGTLKRATAGPALFLGLGREAGPPGLVHFRRRGPRLTAREVDLPAPEGERTEILGLAADDRRWVVIYRVGAAEGHGSEVRLVTADGAPREVEALHDALAVESMKLTDEGLAVIAAFEFSRPRIMTLGLGPGAEGRDTEPLIIPPGALPPAFAGERRAFLRDVDGQLSVDVESAAGDPIARRVPVLAHIGAPTPPADITRQGDEFLIATMDHEDVVTIRVACH